MKAGILGRGEINTKFILKGINYIVAKSKKFGSEL